MNASSALKPRRWSSSKLFLSSFNFKPRLPCRRQFHASGSRSWPLLTDPRDLIDNESPSNDNQDSSSKSNDSNDNSKKKGRIFDILLKTIETAGIMITSLSMLGLAGLTYHRMYEAHTLNKMAEAFKNGDPTFQISMHRRAHGGDKDWVQRTHQDLLNDVIAGKIVGRYYLIIGEKGTGKTSMLLEAMNKVNGRHCAYMDAHADPEIFRIRLGKALNFAFHEDYLGALFSIRGPRDTTALLDIERAFNTLEKVATRHFAKHQQPLTLIINSAHLIRDDQQGKNLVELLQQKAEALSGTGLVTIIFNSDDYWLYERLKKLSTRLEVITINDFQRDHAIRALRLARQKFFHENIDDKLADQVYGLVGGRPQHLASVASQPDMITACQRLIDKEKIWFLNQCGLLGEDMDDDVMESGKFSTSAMFLMKEMVEMDRTRLAVIGSNPEEQRFEHEIPKIPLWRARQIMTRPDYIEQYDNLNIFTIDSNSMVKPDSVAMLQAFHEITLLPGFDELLQQTAARVDAIESLSRTRELVAKDLVLKGSYKIITDQNGGITLSLDQVHDESDDQQDDENLALDKEQKYWWTTRMDRLRTKADRKGD